MRGRRRKGRGGINGKKTNEELVGVILGKGEEEGEGRISGRRNKYGRDEGGRKDAVLNVIMVDNCTLGAWECRSYVTCKQRDHRSRNTCY